MAQSSSTGSLSLCFQQIRQHSVSIRIGAAHKFGAAHCCTPVVHDWYVDSQLERHPLYRPGQTRTRGSLAPAARQALRQSLQQARTSTEAHRSHTCAIMRSAKISFFSFSFLFLCDWTLVRLDACRLGHSPQRRPTQPGSGDGSPR